MEISLHVNIDITLLRVLATGDRAKYPHTGNAVFGGILRHILTQQSYIFGLCLHKRCFNEPNISFICHPYKKTAEELSEFLIGRFLLLPLFPVPGDKPVNRQMKKRPQEEVEKQEVGNIHTLGQQQVQRNKEDRYTQDRHHHHANSHARTQQLMMEMVLVR